MIKLACRAARALSICLFPLAIAVSASAQDWQAPAVAGEYALEAGFLPDPIALEIEAGGQSNAEARLPGTCNGFVTEGPSVRIHYRGGDYQLAFYALSQVDTTMVVNAPDGRWYCRDDFQRLNPAVVFTNPLDGQYDVWVGTFSSWNAGSAATLYITEGTPFGG